MTRPIDDPGLLAAIDKFQKLEITEYHIYKALAARVPHEGNRQVLTQIAQEELAHYDFWKGLSGRDVKPGALKIFLTSLAARILGLTFVLKFMERGERGAQRSYQVLTGAVPAAKAVLKDEEDHEHQLLNMIEEERLRYTGSVVLGLSDALVELTGTLAGLTFALQNTRIIAVAGLITGIAASFSMAASEYLSQSSDGGTLSPLKSAVYTFIAYLFTVVLLVVPYFVFANCFTALAVTVFHVVVIVWLFSFYISIARGLPSWRRFVEMTTVCLGVAAVSFVIGVMARSILNIDLH